MAAAFAPTTSRTPSPAPQPPIPAAPGPRATALQRLFDDAVTHVLKTCSYAHFSACFPTAAARVPGPLAHLHAQFIEKLGKSMRTNFATILENREVVNGLNSLDNLIDEARRRKAAAEEKGELEVPVPPHTLPAAQLYAANIGPLLTEPMAEIGARQKTLEAENVELLDRVQLQRRQIEQLVQGLESALGDLEASVASLEQSADPEELRDEIRLVEGDLSKFG